MRCERTSRGREDDAALPSRHAGVQELCEPVSVVRGGAPPPHVPPLLRPPRLTAEARAVCESNPIRSCGQRGQSSSGWGRTPGATLIEQWPFFRRPFKNVTKVIGIAAKEANRFANRATRSWIEAVPKRWGGAKVENYDQLYDKRTDEQPNTMNGFRPTRSITMPPGISTKSRVKPKEETTRPTREYEMPKEEA